ncbi:MAG: FliH/SctL family protein [Syntrophorhabdales bacterium]|jgi:flagellar biosynthesis/type III secretory pathway protein FliH
MNDSSRVSIPFTFDDLGIERDERSATPFISFFREEAEEAEEETVDEAPPPPEDLVRKAFEDAYVEGEKAGYDMGMRRAESIAKRLERHIEEVASFKKVLEERYEKLAVQLALMFAEAIILRECDQRRDILEAMVRRALEACEEKGDIVIRVRAEDARYVEDIGSDQVKVVTDDALKEPGFIIETGVGDIDGRISSQIEELKNALTGYHRG